MVLDLDSIVEALNSIPETSPNEFLCHYGTAWHHLSTGCTCRNQRLPTRADHEGALMKLSDEDLEIILVALGLAHHPYGTGQWHKRRHELIELIVGYLEGDPE